MREGARSAAPSTRSYGLEAVTGSTFTANTATGGGATGDGFGGAIYDDSGLSTISGDTFTSNSVSGTGTDNEGGAVYDDEGVTIAASTFSANTATNGFGGAISEEGDGLNLTGDTITGNQAIATGGDEAQGGGVYGDDVTNISSSTISGNHADTGGGGVYLDGGMIMTSSRVAGNTSNLGAGVFDDTSSDAILQATGSAIVDNVASGAANAGGGVYVGAATRTGSTSKP